MMVQRQIKYMIALIGVLSMTACGVKNQYTTEDMDLPETFQVPDSVSENLDSTLVSREEIFKDTVLIGLIDSAFDNNFDVRVAKKEIAINDAYFKQSKAAFYPSLNLNLFNIEKDWRSHNSHKIPQTGWYEHKGENPPKDRFVSKSYYSTTAALDWEVDIWGKLRHQKKEAQALYEQSHMAKRVIQTELIATVAEDYYTLLMMDEQLEVAKKNHEFRDSTLRMIKLLYKSGEVSALAVQQSQTQVLEASSLISELKEKRSVQENNLRLLTGELPGDIERKDNREVADSSYNTISELPLYLVQNRPDVVVARYGLTAANEKVGVRQAQRLPNLRISLEGGVESMLPKNWFNIPGSLLGRLAGGLTAPIFEGRRLKTQYEIAQLERDEAEINFQRNVYGAIVDIKNTLISLDRLQEQAEIANVKKLVAHKALKNSRMLFQSGYADYLEVLTAQSEAMQSELDQVEAKTHLLISRIRLYRALGGGWK